jgi:hypothetical protein
MKKRDERNCMIMKKGEKREEWIKVHERKREEKMVGVHDRKSE